MQILITIIVKPNKTAIPTKIRYKTFKDNLILSIKISIKPT